MEEQIKRKTNDKIILDGFSGNSFGDKLKFSVGMSFISCGVLGVLKGFYDCFPVNTKLPRSILYREIFYSMNAKGVKWANYSASAALLFCLNGMIINYLFESELEDVNKNLKNSLVGGITGAIYKSTRGYRPMIVGGVTGALFLSLTTYVIDNLNERDLVSFEISI